MKLTNFKTDKSNLNNMLTVFKEQETIEIVHLLQQKTSYLHLQNTTQHTLFITKFTVNR